MRFDGALVNGNSALTEETPKSSLAPFTVCGHSKKTALCNQIADRHQEPHHASTVI